MNEIYHRVSIRKYEDRLVEEEKILQILKAAMQAPSAGNQQPWEFYVVTNKEKIQALGQVAPQTRHAAGAPVVIVAAYQTEGLKYPPFAHIDLSIAMENMWLETDSLGLGGLWMGIAPLEDRMTKVEEIIGLPEGIRAFGLFSVGYPAETKEQQDRFKPERIHYVK